MRRSIVLFARSPEREASAKRMRFAAPLFRALIASWLDAARRHHATPVIACAADDRDALASIAPEIEREWIEQRGDSFGERVAHATDETFKRGFDAVLVAAIDAPPHDLAAAFASLERGIPVISPSRDGGINFIGLVQPEPELLARLELHRRDLVHVCKRHFRNAGVPPAGQAASPPPGGETPPAQPPGTAAFHVICGSIDVDNESALAIARTDRAWRWLLIATSAAQPRNRVTAQPVDALARASRAPPQFV